MPAAGIQRQLKASFGVLKVDYLHTYLPQSPCLQFSTFVLPSSGSGISGTGTSTENMFLVI